jgi:acyl carrier protein
MNNSMLREKLLECFRAVFPGLTDAQLLATSAESNERWDSIAHVTLLSLIEEEFGSSLAMDRLTTLTSFPALLGELERFAA